MMDHLTLSQARRTSPTLEHRELRVEYIDAWQTGGQTVIRTPGFGDSLGGRREQPLADVLYDAMAGKRGDAILHEIIALIAGLAHGDGSRLCAMALIASLAKEHADYHAGDAS